MGFISGIKYKYSRKSAEKPIFPTSRLISSLGLVEYLDSLHQALQSVAIHLGWRRPAMGWPWPVAPRYDNVLRNEDYTAGKPTPHPIEASMTHHNETI